jgi:hypothetical protein
LANGKPVTSLNTLERISALGYTGGVRVVADPRFVAWYRRLRQSSATPEVAIAAKVQASLNWLAKAELTELGPPRAERIVSSRHAPKIWELRQAAVMAGRRQVVVRVLVVVHDEETAVALVGGDKADNWQEWYQSAVPTADSYYDDYVRRTKP